MTTMRLARRTRSAVTNCDRCAERSTPWRAAAATASGGGGRPGPRKPAESTRTPFRADARVDRSEEHTSELQSPCNLVCRLLLEKKKKTEHETSNSNTVAERHAQLLVSWALPQQACKTAKGTPTRVPKERTRSTPAG